MNAQQKMAMAAATGGNPLAAFGDLPGMNGSRLITMVERGMRRDGRRALARPALLLKVGADRPAAGDAGRHQPHARLEVLAHVPAS